MVVANPAYASDNPEALGNFTRAAYHGPVVWAWQQAMMVQGGHCTCQTLCGCSSVARHNMCNASMLQCMDASVRHALCQAANTVPVFAASIK